MSTAEPMTFEVWGGHEPSSPDADEPRPREPRGHVTFAITLAALVSSVVAAGTVLGVQQLRAAADAQPTSVATLTPAELEKLTISVGGDEWVMIRRPHQAGPTEDRPE